MYLLCLRSRVIVLFMCFSFLLCFLCVVREHIMRMVVVVHCDDANDVADDDDVGHDCFGHVVVAEVSGGVVCDVGVVVDLV